MKSESGIINEEKRLAEFERYLILDSETEAEFDKITSLAATACETPIAIISLVDSNRVWFKSCYGFQASEIPREDSFCTNTIQGEDIFIVEDAANCEEYRNNPLFINSPNTRFYAGVPLITKNGNAIGTLCVLDKDKKKLRDSQISVLKALAKHVMELIELKIKKNELTRIIKENSDIQRLTNTGTWEWDIEKSITIWSDQTYDIYGLPRGTPVSEIDSFSYFAPDDRERLSKLIQRTVTEKEYYNEDFQFVDANGVKKWVRSIGKPYANSQGEVYKVIGTFQDITAQIELESTIAEVNAYARGLDQYAIVAKTDQTGKITYVNDLFCHISGYSRGELIGQNHRILNSGTHNKHFFKNLWDAISAGNIWKGEINNKAKDGSSYWVDTIITPSIGPEGKIQEYISFRYDITERKIFEEQLRQSEEKHRVLFNQSFDPVLTLAPPTWRYTSGNPAALSFFGITDLDKMIEYLPWDVSPEFQPDGQLSSAKAMWAIENAMNDGSFFFEWDHKKKDGKIIPSTILLSRIKLGEKTFLQANIRDITEQKKFQQELIDSRLNLEKSYKFLEIALDGANLGIWDWDLKTGVVKYDRRWAALLGLNVSDLKQDINTWKDRVHKDDLKRCEEDIEKILNEKSELYENIHRLRHSDGHWVHIISRGKISERDNEGKATRFSGTHFDISTQKNLEQLFIEAQAISKIGNWQLNLLTNEQTWSTEHYKIFEIEEPQSQSELYALYRGKIHPEDLKTLDCIMENALNNGENFTYDHRVILKNGSIKYVQGIGKVTRNENGEPIRISGTCRDRTQDVQTEERFKTLIETMSEGLVVHDFDGQIIQYNTSALKILDISEDQLMGRTSKDPDWRAIKEDGSDFIGTDHPAMIALQTGKIVTNVTMGLKLKNNETRWIRINAVPVYNLHGRRALVTFSDISELIQANEENRFVLDTIGIGVWKFNPATNDLHWDKSMYKIFGIDEAKFSGHYNAWESSLTNDAKVLAIEELGKALRGEKEFASTFEIKTSSNNKKYIGGRGKVIRSSSGEPVMMYGVNWDRTKEVELEQNLELEKAKALHNAKLASIGELAAGVGHEINNPLAIISGQLAIVEDHLNSLGIKNEFVTDRFNRIELAISRISNIIKGLRVFSRSDESQKTVFDVVELVKETVDMLKDIYQTDGIKLTLNCNTQVSIAFGNRGRIQQVVVNLLSNAKDATEGKDERKIEITLSKTENKIQITVSDNGQGIPEEIRDKVFNPFFTTKEINKGTGIGLSLVSTIIKEHKGTIEIQTQMGLGTKFIIKLPFADASLTTETNSAQTNKQIKIKKKCQILIVDDEEDLRDILSIILSKSFTNVFVAEDAKTGLKLLSEMNFDLVLSDVKMPHMDGFTFLKLIRENQTIHQPKFMFLSGGVEMDSKQEAIVKSQTSGILGKPFNEALLLEAIRVLFPDE